LKVLGKLEFLRDFGKKGAWKKRDFSEVGLSGDEVFVRG